MASSLASREVLLRAASCAVTAIVNTQEQEQSSLADSTEFDKGGNPLPLPLELEDYSGLKGEESVLVFAMALLRRVVSFIKMSESNLYEVVAITLLTAGKLNFDRFKGNCYWAKMTGIPVSRLNLLEIELYTRLDYRLNIQVVEYQNMLDLIGHMIESESFASINIYQNAVKDTIQQYEEAIQSTITKYESAFDATVQLLSPRSRAKAGLGKELLEDHLELQAEMGTEQSDPEGVVRASWKAPPEAATRKARQTALEFLKRGRRWVSKRLGRDSSRLQESPDLIREDLTEHQRASSSRSRSSSSSAPSSSGDEMYGDDVMQAEMYGDEIESSGVDDEETVGAVREHHINHRCLKRSSKRLAVYLRHRERSERLAEAIVAKESRNKSRSRFGFLTFMGRGGLEQRGLTGGAGEDASVSQDWVSSASDNSDDEQRPEIRQSFDQLRESEVELRDSEINLSIQGREIDWLRDSEIDLLRESELMELQRKLTIELGAESDEGSQSDS